MTCVYLEMMTIKKLMELLYQDDHYPLSAVESVCKVFATGLSEPSSIIYTHQDFPLTKGDASHYTTTYLFVRITLYNADSWLFQMPQLYVWLSRR